MFFFFHFEFPGELRKVYNDEPAKLRSTISWYEMAFQVGRNVGSGTPVLFTWVHVHFGFWKLDKLNIVNMILAVFCLVATILNFFRARDLSKDLERMKEKYAAPQEDKERKDEKTSKSLMKWSELLQIDILTLCLAYSLIRYATGTFTSSMTIMLPMDYHWSLNGMLVLIMCTNCFTSVTTIILVKLLYYFGETTFILNHFFSVITIKLNKEFMRCDMGHSLTKICFFITLPLLFHLC